MSIGVDDDATIHDLRGELRRQYASTETAALPQQLDAYVRDVRNLLGDCVAPSPRPVINWIEAAGLYILRIEIPSGNEKDHAPLWTIVTTTSERVQPHARRGPRKSAWCAASRAR